MPTKPTPRTMTAAELAEGAWLALEQCGHLLGDAALLFRDDRYATSVGIAITARDEFGKYVRLLELWVDATNGKQVTTDAMEKNHLRKQEHAALSLTLRSEDSQARAAAFASVMVTEPGSPARQTAIRDFGEAKVRTEERKRAFYVDPRPAGWSRPSQAFTKEGASRIVNDAINEYRSEFDPINRDAHLELRDPGLLGAVIALVDKPDLPPPPWI